jgi:hypothetical protein
MISSQGGQNHIIHVRLLRSGPCPHQIPTRSIDPMYRVAIGQDEQISRLLTTLCRLRRTKGINAKCPLTVQLAVLRVM